MHQLPAPAVPGSSSSSSSSAHLREPRALGGMEAVEQQVRVTAKCPDARWRLRLALPPKGGPQSHTGGLTRAPSEPVALWDAAKK